MPNPLRIALSALLLAAVVGTSPVVGQRIPSPYRFVDTRQEGAVGAGVANLASGRFGFGPKEAITAEGRWGITLSGPLAFEVAAVFYDYAADRGVAEARMVPIVEVSARQSDQDGSGT